jgi:hypothetical protein
MSNEPEWKNMNSVLLVVIFGVFAPRQEALPRGMVVTVAGKGKLSCAGACS